MKIPKENVVDLRTSQNNRLTSPASPRRGEAMPSEPTLPNKNDIGQSPSVLHALETSQAPGRKNPVVLVLIVVIGAGLITYFAVSGNYLASLVFFLGGILIAYRALTKRPQRVVCKIRAQGIQVNKDLYPYHNLKSFWIFYDPPRHKELSIKSTSPLSPYVKIPLGDEDPVKIREILTKFLPERKQEETLSDIFARMVGL